MQNTHTQPFVLVTGAAGFIGFHVSKMLLESGYQVLGIDNLNNYYDVVLKQARLDVLQTCGDFHFRKVDIADKAAMLGLAQENLGIRSIIHLAAQASVQYSLKNPYVYVDANVLGQLNVLEIARHWGVQHFMYASTSSVYGCNTKLPFSVEDRVDSPMAIYAATKRASELMSHAYSHLYGIPTTGFRFFTVYGPWGRPDMAAFLFTRRIVNGEPIVVYNHGNMRRNFTYIDDIVSGLVAALSKPPQQLVNGALHRIYNLGNSRSEDLMTFVHTIERALGKKAVIEQRPMLPGDVKDTVADIRETTEDFGFVPKTNIEVGIPIFVQWFKEFYRVA